MEFNFNAKGHQLKIFGFRICLSAFTSWFPYIIILGLSLIPKNRIPNEVMYRFLISSCAMNVGLSIGLTTYLNICPLD